MILSVVLLNIQVNHLDVSDFSETLRVTCPGLHGVCGKLTHGQNHRCAENQRNPSEIQIFIYSKSEEQKEPSVWKERGI